MALVADDLRSDATCHDHRPGRDRAAPEELQAVNAIRVLAMDSVEQAGSGHPGTPMGLATTGYTLWSRFLSFDSSDPDWPNRDRYVMSNGHAGLLHYALLHLTGFPLTLDDLKSFRQWGSKAPGHPERGVTPGIEVTTGPLGQGIANGVGMAIAERMLASRFNRPGHEIVDHRTWVIAGDGDMMEGVASEAASLAGHLGLGRLTVLYDDNHISIEGSTDIAFCEEVGARFASYGWQVLYVENGNDVEELSAALKATIAEEQGPTLIQVRTSIGYGSPGKQDTAEAHGAPLGPQEVAATRRNLGWESQEPFVIPDDVYAHYREIAERAHMHRRDWDQRLARYADEHPKAAAAFERRMSPPTVTDWRGSLPTFEIGTKVATRKASGKVINAIASQLPELIGGSADLAPSTSTSIEGADDIARGNFSGRNFHFGVREHGMGGILNGISAHGGFRPYGATFLIFSDYMRPSIRLAALMELPVTYVMTHDSIALGEDGPTHQPVEHLMSLRAIPNLVVMRPADANETAQAWRVALKRTKGPTLLVLSRQDLPVLESPEPGVIDNGARIVEEGSDVAIVATGSEVELALNARSVLAGKGISARVVSMISMELFDEAPGEYRDHVLPPRMPVVAVEAGVTRGWERYADTAIGLDRFGASAPGDVVLERLGFTPERVAEEAVQLIGAALQGGEDDVTTS
jgi:transketolase